MEVGGVNLGQGVSLTGLADILTRLNVGDVLRAQIIEIASNELLLKLLDGSTLTAASTVDIDANKGDFVDFVVKSKSESQLFLETIRKPSAKPQIEPEAELKKQLVSLDIKPDARNLEIAGEMKTNRLPLTKEKIEQVLDLLLKFKDLTPSKAVFLSASELVPHENNIRLLNTLTEGKLKITSDLQDLLKILSEVDPADFSLNKTEKQNPISNKPNSKSLPISFQLNPQDLKELDLKQPFLPLKSLDIRLEAESLPKTTNDMKNIFEADDKLIQWVAANKNRIVQQPEKLEQMIASEFKQLTETQQKSVTNLIKNQFVLDFTKEIKALDGNSDQETKSRFNVKDKLQEEIKDVFVKLGSDTLEKDIDVAKLYKGLVHKLENLREVTAQANISAKTEIFNKIDSLSDNLRFLNEINNQNTYAQIPIQMGSHKTTGELYILKRDSKRKKINPEDATLFLSLSTQNIGQVESLISIRKKNVSIQMRVEDKQIIDFIKENYKELYLLLGEKGFKLVDVKYKLIDEPSNPVNIQKLADRHLNVNGRSIDYRL